MWHDQLIPFSLFGWTVDCLSLTKRALSVCWSLLGCCALAVCRSCFARCLYFVSCCFRGPLLCVVPASPCFRGLGGFVAHLGSPSFMSCHAELSGRVCVCVDHFKRCKTCSFLLQGGAAYHWDCVQRSYQWFGILDLINPAYLPDLKIMVIETMLWFSPFSFCVGKLLLLLMTPESNHHAMAPRVLKRSI